MMKKNIKNTINKAIKDFKTISRKEAMILITLFIIPIPCTVELYIASKTIYKKYFKVA